MAICEKDMLLLQSRNMLCMLLCGEDRYHIVKVDDALTEEREEKLMQIYPCSEQSMREIGIHFEVIKKAQISRVQISGSTAGERIVIWQGKSRRTFILEDDTTEEALTKIFNNITRGKTTAKTKGKELDAWRKKEQDPEVFKKMKILRIWLMALNAIALIAYWIQLPINALWGGICVLLLVADVVLVIKYPVYFTFLDLIAFNKSNKYRTHNGIGLGALCVISGCLLLFRTVSKTYLVWYGVYVAGLIIAVCTCIAFWFWSKDARSSKSLLAAIVLCITIVGTGVVDTMNEILDSRAPQVKSYIVENKHVSSGKTTSYYLEIKLEDGSEFDIKVDSNTYSEIVLGDTVRIARKEGGLGLAYMYYVED